MRKIAAMLVAFGLTLGLLGAGISATFTDSATATTSITVGSFNIDISTTQVGAVTVDGSSVTFTCPDILSSGAGSCALPFTITSTGSIPADLLVTANTPASPFSDLLAAGEKSPNVIHLTQGQHHDFAAGLQWGALTNANLGQAVSITYTINAAQ